MKLKIDVSGTVGDEAWRALAQFPESQGAFFGPEFGASGKCNHSANQPHPKGEWISAEVLVATPLLAQYAMSHYLEQERVLDVDIEHEEFVTSPTPIVKDPNFQRGRMSTRNRILFFVVAWAIVLLPFLFWRSTWFGRSLSDRELDQYIHDQQKPRHTQHALVQLGERMAKHDPSAARWYPDVVRLAASPVEEIRNTDAWIMGQDNSRPEFHRALLPLLNDPSSMVRANAALSLVRFGDASGRPQLVQMLQPAKVTAPQGGRITDLAKVGEAIRQNGTIAKIEANGKTEEVRSPIAGHVRSFSVTRGAQVQSGTELAMMDPAPEQLWEALRALYLVGQKEDLPAVTTYVKSQPNMPDRVREQAILTEKAILARDHAR